MHVHLFEIVTQRMQWADMIIVVLYTIYLFVFHIVIMSAVGTKKAQNNLTCPVCYQLFNNPKYLPCYHSYCEGCLEKIALQSEGMQLLIWCKSDLQTVGVRWLIVLSSFRYYSDFHLKGCCIKAMNPRDLKLGTPVHGALAYLQMCRMFEDSF